MNLLLLFLLAQSPEPVAAARTAVDELGTRIRALLSEELARGGFAAAVEMCATKAQPATEAYAKEKGIGIRRVSVKPRNPKDTPDEYERRVMEEWGKSGAKETSAEVTGNGGGRELRLMRPIVMQPMCLACHGEPAPEVRAAIAKHYPNDPATGYKAGDLRGAFSVRVKVR
jgi:hypothetical protein